MGMYFYENFLGKSEPLSYVTDKDLAVKSTMRYMIIRLQRMFKYENLPDSIPREILEYYLLCNGTCIIANVSKDESSRLVALTGSLSAELDEYYRPTKYIVANPALKLSKEYVLGKDAVLMRNDSMWQGLYPLMSTYASMMVENNVTMRMADIMLRVMALLTAPDDKSKIAADTYLAKLEKGELGAIAENRFLDGIKMQTPPSNNGSYLTQFIELHQYLKGSFFNEVGLNANFNMKRESIGDGESSLNEDSLLPLCEEMLRCRREDISKVNEMFGLNISIDFDSAWANNVKEIELDLQQKENEASQLVISEDSQEEPTEEDSQEEPTEEDSQEENTEEDSQEETTEEDSQEETTKEDSEETTKEDSEEKKGDEKVESDSSDKDDSTYK